MGEGICCVRVGWSSFGIGPAAPWSCVPSGDQAACVLTPLSALLLPPWQVDDSIGKTPFPLWAIIACAVGGAVVLAGSLWLLWACCCRKKRPAGPHTGSVSPHSHSHWGGASSYTYSPGSQYAPSQAAHSPGGYPSPGSAGGAWGYGAYGQPSSHTNGGAAYPANG